MCGECGLKRKHFTNGLTLTNKRKREKIEEIINEKVEDIVEENITEEDIVEEESVGNKVKEEEEIEEMKLKNIVYFLKYFK